MDRPTLSRALTSAATQVTPPSEIVVIAACGPHHRTLPDKWQDVPLRLVRPNTPLSRAAAANAVLGAARCSWLNFLDDDDELLPNHLEQLSKVLEAHPAAKLAFAKTEVVDDTGRVDHVMGRPHHPIHLLSYSQFAVMAALFHRSLVDDGAHFDESLAVCEDHDFWIQCACRTPFVFVDAVTSRWFGFTGESGAGVGPNSNPELLRNTLAQVHSKWNSTRVEWSRRLDGLVLWARTAIRDGRVADADDLLDQALRLAPDSAKTLTLSDAHFLAHHALRKNRVAAAVALTNHALALAPADINSLNLGGMAQYYAGNRDAALIHLRAAQRLLPDHPGIAKNLSLVEDRH